MHDEEVITNITRDKEHQMKTISDGYTPIPRKAVDWLVRGNSQSPKQMSIMMYLFSRIYDDQMNFVESVQVRVRDLAKYIGTERTNLYRMLKTLEEEGFITVKVDHPYRMISVNPELYMDE
jgi:hypothetical protein